MSDRVALIGVGAMGRALLMRTLMIWVARRGCVTARAMILVFSAWRPHAVYILDPLEFTKAGLECLFVEKLLHSLLASAFRIDKLQRIAFTV